MRSRRIGRRLRVNRFVRGDGDDIDAAEKLCPISGVSRGGCGATPRLLRFIEWLRAHNDALAANADKTGFYGLDLYSLHASMKRSVLQYLERVDPGRAAKRARARYTACFDHFGPDPQIYGFIATTDLDRSCKEQVVAQLVDLRRHAAEYAQRNGGIAEDELFFAEQNSRLVKNAEEYYRSMFFGDVSSWNLRDSHMVETLDALVGILSAGQACRSCRLGS